MFRQPQQNDQNDEKNKYQDLCIETRNRLNLLAAEATALEVNDDLESMKKLSQTFDSLRSLLDKQEKRLKQRIRHIEKKNEELIINFKNHLSKYDQQLDNMITSKDNSTSLDTLNMMKQHVGALKVPKIITYHIDGIDQFEQSINEFLQKIQINQCRSENENGTKMFSQTCSTMRGPTLNHIPVDATWYSNRTTVAGGNKQGKKVNQLSGPSGLFVDDNDILYIADFNNHRIVKWKCGAKRGAIVAGGNGRGDGPHQLNRPYDVIKDKKNDSLIISDNGNLRVMRWSCQMNATRGEVMISNIACAGLTMDENGYLYVADEGKHEVRRFYDDDKIGTVVAGGNGKGNRLDQLHEPWYIFIDVDQSIYVSDWGNHRVMKWLPGAKQGIVVAGGLGKGNSLSHLSSPEGVVVDREGTVYVSDSWNDRIMRWPKGASQGSVIVGRNRLSCPIGLSFDCHNQLYVVDWGNHRIERFSHQ